MNDLRHCALALDIGGTKILAAAVTPEGRLLACVERPTGASRGAAAVLATAREALDALPQGLPQGLPPVLGLGISSAGVIDPEQARVLDATDALPGWIGTDFRAAFAPAPVHALNDVQAALLGERAWGALAGARHALMLTLGTGLGGALLMDGRLHGGHGHLAGHFGRARLQHRGAWVPVETLVSGTGLARLYREQGGELAEGDGARGVLARDDAAARQALALWVEHLAAQIHNLHWSFAPELILLGGGMLDARARWWPQLEAALGALSPLIRPAALGSRAGVYGAARFLFDQLEAAR